MSEVIAEQIDTVTGEIENVVEIVRNNPVVLAAVVVVGLAVGAAGGYLVAKTQLQKKYEELSNDEIEKAKRFYADFNKVDADGEPLTPQQVFESKHSPEAMEALRVYKGELPVVDVDEERLLNKIDQTLEEKTVEAKATIGRSDETVNVFSDPGFDLDEEAKYRTADQPYVLTHDEFFESAKNYEMITVTYYAVDDVLCDERDQPIPDTDGTVGDDNLVRFGHGSNDKNVVYVRNDKLESDYEVTKHNGSYLEDVLGMIDGDDTSLKHNDQRDRRRAFRQGEG